VYIFSHLTCVFAEYNIMSMTAATLQHVTKQKRENDVDQHE